MNFNYKKIIILLPDGIGLRNFAYTDFYNKLCKDNDVLFWNNTNFPLEDKLGIKEISYKSAKIHFLTSILKTVKSRIELNLNYKKFKDAACLSFIFPKKNTSIKIFFKNQLINFYLIFYQSEKGLKKINKKIKRLERATLSYQEATSLLKKEKPDLIFCTNQRTTDAIAPILAAKDLNIKTATFIYSWDNIPKATLVIEPDYYFVWSNFMKEELIKYYPYIKENQVKITGTPQFEPHFNENLVVSKEEFLKTYNLDVNKKYICFSGNDITSSPFDEYYLEDLAEEVEKLNNTGYNLGIIYRKCPVDFTGRYTKVLENYKHIIVAIDPVWKNLGNSWNKVMPFKEDMQLLANTVRYSELVINVGSSMVFDAVSHKKPCAYLNYNTKKVDVSKWTIKTIYTFIHFQSMPSKEAVLWLNKKEDYKTIIKKVLENKVKLEQTQKWFDKIVKHPPELSSERIVSTIKSILN